MMVFLLNSIFSFIQSSAKVVIFHGCNNFFIELYRLFSQILDRRNEFMVGLAGVVLLILGVIFSLWVGTTGWGYAGVSIWESPVFWKLRLPRTIHALLAGGGLALAGWLMQALFRNPLASPSILGVTNGASLGVAWMTMVAAQWSWIPPSGALLFSGAIGSVVVLILLGVFRKWIGSVTGLLIFGVMMGHFAGALETIFQQWTDRENLSGLIYWSMGAFDRADAGSGIALFLSLGLGVVLVFQKTRTLDAWVMGDDFARSVGISLSSFSFFLIMVSGVLTAVITTYCGPVAFIGLASPHLTKLWMKHRNHQKLLWGVLLTGAIIALYCDIFSRVLHLPLNAMTSLLGAPWVMWWIIKKGRHAF
jgi:iron complex transport system permease protein